MQGIPLPFFVAYQRGSQDNLTTLFCYHQDPNPHTKPGKGLDFDLRASHRLRAVGGPLFVYRAARNKRLFNQIEELLFGLN